MPSTRNNNIVAESDLQAAIAVIRGKFDEKIASSEGLVQRQLLRDCANSILARIPMTVQPISDEAFHVHLARYKNGVFACPVEEDEVVPLDAASIAVAVDFEFDEDELMDQTAIARVRELRQEARAKAVPIISLRAATLDRAASIAERQVKLWSVGVKLCDNASKRDAPAMLEQHKVALEDMKASLKSMLAALQETGTVVPEKLKSLKAALREIEIGLNQQRGCSQVEEALFSRDEPAFTQEDEEAKSDLQMLPPQLRLANLLRPH